MQQEEGDALPSLPDPAARSCHGNCKDSRIFTFLLG